MQTFNVRDDNTVVFFKSKTIPKAQLLKCADWQTKDKYLDVPWLAKMGTGLKMTIGRHQPDWVSEFDEVFGKMSTVRNNKKWKKIVANLSHFATRIFGGPILKGDELVGIYSTASRFIDFDGIKHWQHVFIVGTAVYDYIDWIQSIVGVDYLKITTSAEPTIQ